MIMSIAPVVASLIEETILQFIELMNWNRGKRINAHVTFNDLKLDGELEFSIGPLEAEENGEKEVYHPDIEPES